MIIGIDGSRIKSGGGVAHILGILKSYDPQISGVTKIHLWAIRSVHDSIPQYHWLEKMSYKFEGSNILIQLFWQKFILPKICKYNRIDCLLNLDAGTVVRYSKMVTISQDMLSFEKGQMVKYFFSYRWLRLFILKYIQISSLRNSNGQIFLTSYAKKIIETYTGILSSAVIIPHGIDDVQIENSVLDNITSEISIIYVSNIAPYKNHINVLKAVYRIFKMGFNISFTMVGGGSDGKYKSQVFDYITFLKNEGLKIHVFGFLQRNSVIDLIRKHSVFLFASSCENMPITLLEGMKASIPILCSNRGPMPEILESSGYYFDPENIESIVEAFVKYINTPI